QQSEGEETPGHDYTSREAAGGRARGILIEDGAEGKGIADARATQTQSFSTVEREVRAITGLLGPLLFTGCPPLRRGSPDVYAAGAGAPAGLRGRALDRPARAGHARGRPGRVVDVPRRGRTGGRPPGGVARVAEVRPCL